jgi:3-dehydroquinate synthase
MKSIIIHGSMRDSRVIIGEDIGNIGKYLPRADVIVITDKDVYRNYSQVMPTDKVIRIGTGEKIKNLDTVAYIFKELIRMEADRTVFILGFGGGIVCDIAGFVASIYLRGVRFGFVSTTLLSQADAGVGGKNGVNFEGYKNMIGTFNQPDFIICDPALLETLPEKQIRNGCAEIVKHAAIADKRLFAYLEAHYKEILKLKRDVIEKIVYESVMIKSGVVNLDEKEKGERRRLNFGHTIGHAIEKVTGLTHGEAISAGMCAAARISEKKGILSGKDRARLERILGNMKLPTRISADMKTIFKAMIKDKKREGDSIHFVLLNGIGDVVIEKISIKELEGLLMD